MIDGKYNINGLSIEQKTPMSEDNKKFSYSEPNCIHTLQQVYSFFLKNLFLWSHKLFPSLGSQYTTAYSLVNAKFPWRKTMGASMITHISVSEI